MSKSKKKNAAPVQAEKNNAPVAEKKVNSTLILLSQEIGRAHV